MADSNNAIRLPAWLIALIATILLFIISTAFAAGGTFNTVQELKQRMDRIEQRLSDIEIKLQGR